ncbi:E3 ubiquitin-protein ligase RNF31 [Lonchura striata]
MADPPKDPPDLGSLQELRSALQVALLRRPAEPWPPALAPLLLLPLPPQRKLRLLPGRQLLRENLAWNPEGLPHGLERLRTALNILEKYGRNLLSPRPPRHWRSVRFGNPVFKSTVGAIQGGREVLKLLGYTEESGEGLSFPPPPRGPHPPLVAAVTADVLLLRAELDRLLLNQHPNPHFFTEILLGEDELVSDALPQLQTTGPAPSCQICGDVTSGPATPSRGSFPPTSGLEESTSGSKHSTSGLPNATSGLENATSGLENSTSGEEKPTSGLKGATSGLEEATSGLEVLNVAGADVTSGCDHAPSRDALRRRKLLEDGQRLVELVRAAERQGLPPESLGPAPFSHLPEVSDAAAQIRHFRGRLGGVLAALRGGAEPALDFQQADQQALVRQILATCPVASWGRALLVASLGRELGLGLLAAPSSDPLLVELVEAVGSCPDRAVLRRRLRCECAVCGWGLPRQLMQWLPGCSCPLCPECFRLHFTVGLRERGVEALGCPSCGRPDLRDDAQRLWYWSTLEPALRRCLDPDTFGLVTRKLTELELQRDPQFLWCPHCSFGFIFEAERGPAQCPQCHQCCCPRCQLPLPSGSLDTRRSPAPNSGPGSDRGTRRGPPQGLGAFLGETGIACPRCGQRFALARGGCLHFQCSQCRHQFCAGCGVPFHQPGSCPSPQCPLGGSLHGHHPRDCLFYLRDWEPTRLQQLLQSGNVAFETEPPPDAPPNPTALIFPSFLPHFLPFLPLPSPHYCEYLVSLINRHGLDPAPLYDPAELRAAAERHLAAGRTRRRPGESEAEHRLRMLRLLGEEAPLRPRPQGAGLRALCK